MTNTEISLAAFALGLAANTAERVVEKEYVGRSLRPGGEYRTRAGRPAEIMQFDDGSGSNWPVIVRYQDDAGRWITGARTKAGLHPNSRGDDPADILEVNPPMTKWLRIYDRKLNDAGKQVVGGKEFAAERGLFIYMFDTEAEARSSLQGVRAIVPLTYREGEGLA